MGKGRKRSKFAILERRLKQLYHSWDKTFCPALGADVHFTGEGWNHIRKSSRTKPQIERRLKLLPLAKRMIEESLKAPTKSPRKKDGKWITYHVLTDKPDNIDLVLIFLKSNVPSKPGYIFISDFEDDYGH